ncbi:MAG: hypothetical protein WCA22_19745 [Candidatus Binatus sp.]
MLNWNQVSNGRRITKRAISTIAVVGLLALGGCSSSEPSAAQQASLAKTELHFNINTCQQIDTGLYKCPSVDKPICSPDYNGQAECVRIGPKGSVFVQSGFAN